ncbi:DNA methyltransferase [Tsukamurella pseudospumae]|uniref:site-specific DNA-methyltransferase (adenine-specific) n=1 Tax=Tsukamurella pseudospumae TaxID=239498 RepID=A0A138AE41_9ACTN|nr:DNA methyltransferase [Tsukamurella pseudospumae]KXP08736.1 DNA methyltransferase [Tsukamurella pseudospumae]
MEPENLKTSLAEFVAYRKNHLKGDEKGEATIFLDRLFMAFGHGGIREAGAVPEARIHQMDFGNVCFADLMWKPHCIVEMKKAGTDLSKHYSQAFKYWMQAVPDRPRWVVLCNFDEFWVYDFDVQLDEPMDKLSIDDLPQRREVLAFLLSKPEVPIFGNDLVKVTREAAAQVSGVFRTMHERGISRLDAQRFVLQSVVTMFAEDIGLLPSKFFTRTLEESKNGADAYDLLGSLFREMNSAGVTKGGHFAGTPYFNGGLFSEIVPVEMTMDELKAMRIAASTDWSDVRPEIFGTLFETSMDKGERHAYGAHFTSQADIARVVLPCIVDPWRERIQAAKTIAELEQVRFDMGSFRVLDPACGSGNFLYVAYREMRRLEAEVKLRIQQRQKVRKDQVSISYVTPDHFLGLDNNRFAVEVAKVTMMMAKKLAADELDEQADALPLDNLDGSIRWADALFTPWPKSDVIIGNPPYNGRRKMVEELGSDYCSILSEKYPHVGGVSDFVTYWFPLAQQHLPDGGRAGFVATQAIRDNDSRKASLEYVVDHGGVIFDAVSVKPWSGDAVVHVSIVNWIKGADNAPAEKLLWLDEGELKLPVPHIPTTLRPLTDVTKAADLPLNKKPKLCFQGQTTGNVKGFRLTTAAAKALIAKNPRLADVVHPMVSGDPLIHLNTVPGYVIDIAEDDLIKAKIAYPEVMSILAERVLPGRKLAAEKEANNNAKALAANPKAKPKKHHTNFFARWWKHSYRREDMLAAITPLERYIALTIVAGQGRRSIYEFVASSIRPDASVQVFALDDDYSFGVLSSDLHRKWFDERCSKLKVDPRYTPTTVWNTFPWPSNPSELQVARIAKLSGDIIGLRATYREQGLTLGQQYDALREPGKSALRDLHDELDTAVVEAYGFNPDEDLLAQLLALNLAAAKDPEVARKPGGQGRPGIYRSTHRLTAS